MLSALMPIPKRRPCCRGGWVRGPAYGVELDELRRGERAVARGQMPRLLHSCGLHAHAAPTLWRAALLPHRATHAPVRLRRPSRRPTASLRPPRSLDVAAKRCRIVSLSSPELVLFFVAVAAISYHRHGLALRQQLLQSVYARSSVSLLWFFTRPRRLCQGAASPFRGACPVAARAWTDCRRRSRSSPSPRRSRAARPRPRESTNRTSPKGPRPRRSAISRSV